MFSQVLEYPVPSDQTEPPLLRVAVCGEVSAGKSTVVNALLRQKVLPSYLGHGYRPSVMVRHGAEPRLSVVFQDGREEVVSSFDDLSPLDDIAVCVVVSDEPHLAGLEIVELPFLTDNDLPDEVFDFLETADVMIWVTIASQAWRLTEKHIIDYLDEVRPDHALIAVSRADKLRSAQDWDKIYGRLQKETAEYFRDVVFMRGSTKILEKAGASDEAWEESSGLALAQVLGDYARELRNGAPRVASRDDAALEDEPEPVVSQPLQAQPEETPRPEAVQAAFGGEGGRLQERLGPDVVASLREMVGTLYGVVAAGIVPLEDPEEVLSLGGTSEAVSSAARFCAQFVKPGSEVFSFDGGADEQPELAMSLAEHNFVFRMLRESNVMVFLMSHTDKMNQGIARTAFHRLLKAYAAGTGEQVGDL